MPEKYKKNFVSSMKKKSSLQTDTGCDFAKYT